MYKGIVDKTEKTMHDIYDSVKTFLESWGLWSLLIVLVAKYITGVLVAIKEDEFKWYYLGEFFKNDGLKVAAYGIMVGVGKLTGLPEFNQDVVQGAFGVALFADLVGGLLKNLAHLSDTLAENFPSSVRQPARLRLGNVKNLPRA
jgi:hypothetical protein